jgi:7-carboxy-7-deazaguanine synthase (Cx14CxxC type)
MGTALMYSIKEIFYTLQGEGVHTGRPAVLCRFAGCNLWNGQETGRDSAVCRFCDTDFVGTDGPGGGKFSDPDSLAAAVVDTWQGGHDERFVVFTGGEPTLQLDAAAVSSIGALGFVAAIETNGTALVPTGLDWICVSPKAGAPLRQRCGDELKLVFPQVGLGPADLEHLDFTHWYLQPCDGPAVAANTRAAIDYCLAHPRWRLSMQTHKLLGIP